MVISPKPAQFRYNGHMTTAQNKMTCDFTGKPKTQSFAEDIVQYVESLGPVEYEKKAQLSYKVRRKFLWLWVYEKTPDGTLYLTVCLDKELANEHFHYVNQVSAHRWNHHVEVKSEDIATSKWLKELIREGYEFASR